jgi:class 3 adenylate cyclase
MRTAPFRAFGDFEAISSIPQSPAHDGRIVKRTGDGSLIEFRSVVDAVRCAIEVQNGMIERNSGFPLERRIQFRIGIHLGDVVEESDGDLRGRRRQYRRGLKASLSRVRSVSPMMPIVR